MIVWFALVTSMVAAPHPRDVTHVYGVEDWRLTVVSDGFTRQTRCRIEQAPWRRGGATVVAGAVAFPFNPKIDTSDAWYALDDAPPRPWRDLQPQLVAAGAMAQAERLDNPSGGRVVIPLGLIGAAHHITIQPALHRRPARWRLDPLATLLASGDGLGCRFPPP